MNRGESTQIPLKKLIFIIGLVLLMSCTLMVLTTPIHELLHVVQSTIDPYIDVHEIHLFLPLEESIHLEGHALSSMLGCVVVQEAYPGALDMRPEYADFIQEIVCISAQILITCVVILKTLMVFVRKIR